MRPSSPTITLGVVIPARDAARDLRHLLGALLPQLAGGDECFVIDDGSTDSTGATAAAYPVKLLAQPRTAGPAAARNRGARAARADILVFLDADVVPHADVLQRMRCHFAADPELAAVIGSYDDRPACPTTVSRFRNLLHCYTHRTGNRQSSVFWAGCGAIRRRAFEALGGFDERRFARPSIEDIELGVRLRGAGGRIRLDPEIQVQHRKRWTLLSMLHTDLWSRAVPWSTLILESRRMPADLNLGLGQRVSAASATLAAAMLPLAPWVPAPYAIAALLALVIAINLPFYRFLAGRGGWGFALRAIPLHLLYFLCAAGGFAIALGGAAVRRWSRK
jgi:Glycosyl transferase family 2